MDEHNELRTMIEKGRDKIEWYRQVDPVMLRTLQDMIKDKDYMKKLPVILKTLYEFAFITYAGTNMKNLQLVSCLILYLMNGNHVLAVSHKNFMM